MGLRKDKKARAPGRQPICGLYAAARCVGVSLKSAGDVAEFRTKCFANGLLDARHYHANWVGGTTDQDRRRICEFHGFSVTPRPDLGSGATHMSVKKLFQSSAFFKTKGQWLLCVHNHCLYVKTNMTKRKLCVCDQRGKIMRFVNKLDRPDAALVSSLGQRVVSVSEVESKA